MSGSDHNLSQLPTPSQIGRAVRLYLNHAYAPDQTPEAVRHLIPPEGFEPGLWFAGDSVERTPQDVPLEQVRSFAMRLGNSRYQHMKLRISRPPNQDEFIFTVDSHDAFLHAPAGSADHEVLEAMKKHNAAVAAAVVAAWDAAKLPTEHRYLRRKIRQARESQGK